MVRHTAPHFCSALPAGLSVGAVVALDASAADGWVQIAPRGAVTARDGRRFIFDPEALAAAFEADGTRPPFDIGHNTEIPSASPAPAIGWIEEMQARADGLYARVDWLDAGKAALAGRGYRYVSPCFWRASDGVTARLIKSAALVTSPALSGLPALAAATSDGDLPTMDKAILAALGLPETATAAEALGAVTTLKDPAKFVPIEQHAATAAALTEAQGRIKAIEDAAITAKCDALVAQGVKDGKIAPAAREHYARLARADFDAATAMLAAMPVLLNAGVDEALDADGKPDASGDPVKLGAQARAYMDEMRAKGVTVTATEAVAHLQGAAK